MKTLVAFDLDDTLIQEALFMRSGAHHIAEWLATRYASLNKQRIINCIEAAIFSRRNHYSALEKYLAEINDAYSNASSSPFAIRDPISAKTIKMPSSPFAIRDPISAKTIKMPSSPFAISAPVSCIKMQEVVSEFRRHKPDPEIYHLSPSIKRTLEKLRKLGIPLALITDGRSETQRNKIEAAGLYHFFRNSDIFISEETGHDKTQPDNFISLMHRHPEITKFVYVADNPAKDFRHPLELGWQIHQAPPFPLMIHPSSNCPITQSITSPQSIPSPRSGLCEG